MTPAPPQLRALASDLTLAVVRLNRQLRGQQASTGVTLTQLSALAALHREGAMTPRALAATEKVQPPSMTRVIAALTAAGLAERTSHPTDGRQVIVSLSSAGAALLAQERGAREAWVARRLQNLTPQQIRVLEEAITVLDEISGATS